MSRKAKLFYFKWFPAEAELDEDWCFMSMAERGLYISLLNYSWINNGLPEELTDLARAARLPFDEFTSLWSGRVGKKFFLVDGRLRNGRQEEERCEVQSKSEKNAAASAKRWDRTTESDANGDANAHADGDANGVRRAYNYNYYSSLSNSSSEKESEEPTEKELDEFSVWASETHLAHPNSRNKYQSVQALIKRFSRDPEARALFSRNHALWCQTEKWRDKQGSFAPQLWQWVEDDGWKKPPPVAPKRESAIDRIVREEMEKKANASR